MTNTLTSTKTSQCRAKNPATCPYHGSGPLNASKAQIVERIETAALNNDFEAYADAREELKVFEGTLQRTTADGSLVNLLNPEREINDPAEITGYFKRVTSANEGSTAWHKLGRKPGAVQAALDSENQYVMRAAIEGQYALREHLTPTQLMKLYQAGDATTRSRIPKNVRTYDKRGKNVNLDNLYEKLASDDSDKVRYAFAVSGLAMHSDHKKPLARDRNSRIREALAGNSYFLSQHADTAEDFANDPEVPVRKALANNYSVPDDTLEKLANDGDAGVRLRANDQLESREEAEQETLRVQAEIAAGTYDFGD
jgi:hypothetical protein